MEIYFTSDHHFFHKNIIKYANRSYDNTQEMNNDLINKWNSVVNNDDIVYYLGDFIFSNQKNARRILDSLNGIKYLVVGNHDKFPLISWIDLGFTQVSTKLLINIDNNPVNVSHYQYKDEMLDDRYYLTERMMNDDDNWLLHGHVHTAWKIKHKMINVGVDVWDGYPVHIDEIKRIIKEYIE